MSKTAGFAHNQAGLGISLVHPRGIVMASFLWSDFPGMQDTMQHDEFGLFDRWRRRCSVEGGDACEA